MAKKVRFNMRMDPELKAWLDSYAQVHRTDSSKIVHELLFAMQRGGLVVSPAHVPGASQAFPGSCPTAGSSPICPALVSEE